MKKVNLFGASAMLSLVLSFPVYAGDIQTPTIAPPPPPSANGTATDSTSDLGSPDATSIDFFIDLLLRAF